jgi:cytidyltransferase-like protein
MNDNIVLVTGGFDPLHSGHLDLINSAKEFGRVIVGLHSDEWLTRKKSTAFLSFKERKYILSNLKNVMCVIDFNDSDGTAKDAIKIVKEMFPKNKVLFASRGDKEFNTPEELLFKDDSQVDFIFV